MCERNMEKIRTLEKKGKLLAGLLLVIAPALLGACNEGTNSTIEGPQPNPGPDVFEMLEQQDSQTRFKLGEAATPPPPNKSETPVPERSPLAPTD